MRNFVHGLPCVSRRMYEEVLWHKTVFGNIYTLLFPCHLSLLLALPNYHSPSSQCLKWLLKKLSKFTPIFQLLMPKLHVHKTQVRFTTMFTNRNKCTFPSPVLSSEFVNPQTDTVSYPNLTTLLFFSFSVVHRQEDNLRMAAFSIRLFLSKPSLLSSRQNKALQGTLQNFWRDDIQCEINALLWNSVIWRACTEQPLMSAELTTNLIKDDSVFSLHYTLKYFSLFQFQNTNSSRVLPWILLPCTIVQVIYASNFLVILTGFTCRQRDQIL